MYFSVIQVMHPLPQVAAAGGESHARAGELVTGLHHQLSSGFNPDTPR